VAPPFRIAEFDIIFGKGISTQGCLLDLAEEMEIVNRKGAWYSYKGENVAQGRDKTITYMEQHPEVAKEVEALVREKLASGVTVSATKVSASDVEDEEEVEPISDDF